MSAPEYLRDRGRAIWEAYGADKLPAGSKAMVHEMARLADGLDRLDMILGARASDWAKIILDEVGEVTLEVNPLLGERRQNALAFKQLYQELRTAGIKENGGAQEEAEGRGGLILTLVQNAG